MKKIYLACPYAHRDLAVMKSRVVAATATAARLMLQGHNVFSPLTHSDPVADYLSDQVRWDHGFWLSRDYQWIDACDELWILCLDGWEDSFGVKSETRYARKRGMPTVYLIPDKGGSYVGYGGCSLDDVVAVV